jgi:hypothetical protein
MAMGAVQEDGHALRTDGTANTPVVFAHAVMPKGDR